MVNSAEASTSAQLRSRQNRISSKDLTQDSNVSKQRLAVHRDESPIDTHMHYSIMSNSLINGIRIDEVALEGAESNAGIMNSLA